MYGLLLRIQDLPYISYIVRVSLPPTVHCQCGCQQISSSLVLKILTKTCCSSSAWLLSSWFFPCLSFCVRYSIETCLRVDKSHLLAWSHPRPTKASTCLSTLSSKKICSNCLEKPSCFNKFSHYSHHSQSPWLVPSHKSENNPMDMDPNCNHKTSWFLGPRACSHGISYGIFPKDFGQIVLLSSPLPPRCHIFLAIKAWPGHQVPGLRLQPWVAPTATTKTRTTRTRMCGW